MVRPLEAAILLRDCLRRPCFVAGSTKAKEAEDLMQIEAKSARFARRKIHPEKALLRLREAAQSAGKYTLPPKPRRDPNHPLTSSYFRKLAERNLRRERQKRIERAAGRVVTESGGKFVVRGPATVEMSAALPPLLLLAVLLVLAPAAGCVPADATPTVREHLSLDDSSSVTVTRFPYDGHKYIRWDEGALQSRTASVVHDPDCPCLSLAIAANAKEPLKISAEEFTGTIQGLSRDKLLPGVLAEAWFVIPISGWTPGSEGPRYTFYTLLFPDDVKAPSDETLAIKEPITVTGFRVQFGSRNGIVVSSIDGFTHSQAEAASQPQ